MNAAKLFSIESLARKFSSSLLDQDLLVANLLNGKAANVNDILVYLSSRLEHIYQEERGASSELGKLSKQELINIKNCMNLVSDYISRKVVGGSDDEILHASATKNMVTSGQVSYEGSAGSTKSSSQHNLDLSADKVSQNSARSSQQKFDKRELFRELNHSYSNLRFNNICTVNENLKSQPSASKWSKKQSKCPVQKKTRLDVKCEYEETSKVVS